MHWTESMATSILASSIPIIHILEDISYLICLKVLFSNLLLCLISITEMHAITWKYIQFTFLFTRRPPKLVTSVKYIYIVVAKTSFGKHLQIFIALLITMPFLLIRKLQNYSNTQHYDILLPFRHVEISGFFSFTSFFRTLCFDYIIIIKLISLSFAIKGNPETLS